MKSIRLNRDIDASRHVVRLLILLAGVAGLMAVREGASPVRVPFNGRVARWADLLFGWTDFSGLMIFWLLVALLALGAARLIWRHTLKTPSDRLWS